jgi:hypothetical protein
MTEPKQIDQTLPAGMAPAPAPGGERPLAPTLVLDTLDASVGDHLGTVDGEGRGADARPDRPGYVVAQRYRLAQILGRGAHGRVWEAADLLTGERVALKVMGADSGISGARLRREVASMRLLRLSGVVRLLDEGTDGDRPFLVMERVAGTPFPGEPGPVPWARLEPAAVALLETLARMHAVGIVHRDLKPANILVDAEGRPTILDFGLARPDTTLDEGITPRGTILGTPAYLAPEQVRGDAVGPRADLYAVGVILFEALAGRFPHAVENIMRMLRARLEQPATPLAEVAPAVPRAVADLIDDLLAIEPAGRPSSAAEALDRLRGRRTPGRPTLRRLGPEAPLRALLDAAAAGASLDVYGPRGSGRSRCLDDAATALGRAGRQVIEVRGEAAWSGPWEGALREAAGAGAVVIADDADALAPEVQAALARCREAGTVLRAFAGEPPTGAAAVALGPLDEPSLRQLFVGAERLFHIPEDAARVLHRRTDGLPARLADDVAGWVQAGLARWDGDRIALDRDMIERLEAGLVITPQVPPRPFPEALPTELDDLLGWILLAHPHADSAHLAAAMRAGPGEIEARLRALEARGAVRSTGGRVEALWGPSAVDAWPLERRREVHRRIALAAPPGTPRRLYHLVIGADEDVELGVEIAAEAEHLGRQLALEGRLELATAAVGEGLRAGRRLGVSGAGESMSLLALTVEIALEDGTPRALDRALYELYRLKPRTSGIDQLAQLVHAALAIRQRTERALAEATEMAPFVNRDLERRRQEVRVVASRVRPAAEQQAILEGLRAWADASSDPAASGAYASWQGRFSYRQGRFAEAAELHAVAVEGQRWVTARLAALMHVASCRMEAFQLDEAAAAAGTAREAARRDRLPFHEAAAERILRSVAYRTGAATTPDLELCDAAAQLRVGDWEAMLCLNEAAVAFRAGELPLARELAHRAQRAWTAVGEVSGGALLAATLALACGGAATPEEVGVLVERAIACRVAGVGVQALGLLALAGRAPEVDSARIAELAGQVAPAYQDQRLEVMSVREALDALSRRRPSSP